MFQISKNGLTDFVIVISHAFSPVVQSEYYEVEFKKF